MWVARDKGLNKSIGRLRLFIKVKPARHIYYDKWTVLGGNAYGPTGECPPEYYIEIDPNLFPNLKWEDEAVEVSIVPDNILDDIRDSMWNYGMNNGDIQNISKGFLKRK